jgi:hypothetical protein
MGRDGKGGGIILRPDQSKEVSAGPTVMMGYETSPAIATTPIKSGMTHHSIVAPERLPLGCADDKCATSVPSKSLL